MANSHKTHFNFILFTIRRQFSSDLPDDLTHLTHISLTGVCFIFIKKQSDTIAWLASLNHLHNPPSIHNIQLTSFNPIQLKDPLKSLATIWPVFLLNHQNLLTVRHPNKQWRRRKMSNSAPSLIWNSKQQVVLKSEPRRGMKEVEVLLVSSSHWTPSDIQVHFGSLHRAAIQRLNVNIMPWSFDSILILDTGVMGTLATHNEGQ